MIIKRITILVFSIFILSLNCCDIIGHTHDVELEPFVGEWLFVGSVYEETAPYDSCRNLYLYSDSTFYCEFSYFLNKDSTIAQNSVTGSWYPWIDATYRDNYYIELIFNSDIGNKSWRTHYIENDSTSTVEMIWFSDLYGFDEEYYWVKVQ